MAFESADFDTDSFDTDAFDFSGESIVLPTETLLATVGKFNSIQGSIPSQTVNGRLVEIRALNARVR